MTRRSYFALTLALALMAAPPAGHAVGEAVNGFPNWAERVIHQWMNRARVDPQVEMAACGSNCAEKACYSPVTPLVYSLGLNRAARFHSDEMQRQGYFDHASACTVVSNIDAIYPDSCNGSASCACQGGTTGCPCTSTFDRVRMFISGGTSWSEIIASPSDPNSAFYLWLYEPSSTTGCSSTSANGHRWAILKFNGMVGVGVSGRSTGDFRSGGTLTQIPSGSHYPRQAASVSMWANWYDPAAPSSANVNVEGQCFAMTLGRGTAQNGAYQANVSGFASGCHRYYFQFVDAQNNIVTYPTTGSLAIGSGAGCPDWDAARPSLCGIGPTNTPANTATPTLSRTPTQTPTLTPSRTWTSTPLPSATRTPTRTPTFSPTFTATRSGTPTRTPTSTRTPTVTRTPTPTPTSNALLFTISGSITYAGSGAPVIGALVRFTSGALVLDIPTVVGGAYTAVVPAGDWEIRPYKQGDEQDAIDIEDAARILAISAGSFEDSPAVHLSADVSGNDTVRAYDAALVTRYAAGAIATFPAAQLCDSDWAFIPAPQSAANQTVVLPRLGQGSCTMGAIIYTPVNGNAVNQDFTAVLFGDADLDW